MYRRYEKNRIRQVAFERLIKEAQRKKFNGIQWQVLEWNEPAINFYKNTMLCLTRNGITVLFLSNKKAGSMIRLSY
jgi:hypothetical protein